MGTRRKTFGENTIEIMGGDAPVGFWMFDGNKLSPENFSAVSAIKLDGNIDQLILRQTMHVSKLESMADFPVGGVLSLVGQTLFGPFGCFAGMVATRVAGHSQVVCIGVELTDGRKFIARMLDGTYDKMKKLCA